MTDVPDKGHAGKHFEDALPSSEETDETSLPPGEIPYSFTKPKLAPENRTHHQIGPYKIIAPIGEGGMGTVYLAEQREPVRRKVALKIIKLGMDSKEIIARFETERQALAMMNHPNIARVLDAGTSDEGRPYFVMEYVPGVKITRYCDTQRLEMKERLRLFIQICEAVQHSHQKGVIHRDIKPSNILVTSQHGEKPLVKIIDFGIAKATEHRLTEKTLFTGQGQLIGTPEYMSPEQTDMVGVDVDTRTDIYSLGVLLYELLVGELPFSIRESAFIEVVKKIRDQEPPKPSSRVTTQTEKSANVARVRQTEPRSLARQIRGELDWITLKAMEKDRTHRYAAATDLAADIQRYLNCEPVVAGPPSTTYRLKKFARKNAGAMVALAVVCLAIVSGGTTATVFYFHAKEKQKEAEFATKEAEFARAEADRERDAADQQRTEAEKARNLARDREREAIAAKEREKEHREVAERQRDEVLRLSDIKRLQQLISDADDLWPAYPGQVDGMESWRDRADQLVKNLETHRASLADLRKQAIGGPSEAGPGFGDKAAEWRFADTATQWRHDVVSELVTGLVKLTARNPDVGTIASVDKRLQFARTVEYETLERHRAEWDEAIESIRNQRECPSYDGYRIKPQIGLIPIGRDSRSELWEFSHLQTGEIPKRDDVGNLVVTNETGLIFVLIPGGKFWMGAQAHSRSGQNYDPQARPDEQPVREVEVEPFFLSKYEMTQGQWLRFTGKNPSYYHPGKDQSQLNREGRPGSLHHPVESVSWEEFRLILGRLDLSLPTSMQWEYGTRGGTTLPWWTGKDSSSVEGAGNILDAFRRTVLGAQSTPNEPWDDGECFHAPVGRYRANPFGLHDVIGNLFEFCSDRVSGACALRGGSFAYPASVARSTTQPTINKAARNYGTGARPVRPVQPPGPSSQ